MAGGVNQLEIARRLGVSQRAVSFALSGKTGVSPKTRERILKKAEELGYRPNASARSIRMGRFGQIGLLNSTTKTFSFQPPQFLNAVHDALAAHELYLLYTQLPDEVLASEGFTPRVLTELRVDGLLINYRHHIPPRLIELIESHRVPAIWPGAIREHDCVYPDDRGAMLELVQRLVSLGHRRIALIDFPHPPELPLDVRPAVLQRRTGYLAAMESAGLQPQVVCASVPQEQWTPLLTHTMRAPDRPTAVIATEPRLAGITWSTLVEDLSLRLGRDVSMVSFGYQPTQMGRHLIDTMITPHAEVGRQAVEMLMEKLRDPRTRLAPRACSHALQAFGTIGPAPQR